MTDAEIIEIQTRAEAAKGHPVKVALPDHNLIWMACEFREDVQTLCASHLAANAKILELEQTIRARGWTQFSN